jgi:ABC-type dipeptide/oligopeptide/nickel transport system ATPase component
MGRAYSLDEIRNPQQPEVLSWPDFQVMFLRSHRQGEHVSIVGPTGGGKTLVGTELCKLLATRKGKNKRPASVTILTFKPRDDTISALGWPVVKKWPPSYGEEHCIVWPRGGPPSSAIRKHRAVFIPLLDTIYAEGGQTVYIPEAAYFERPAPGGLSMGGTMEQFWTTARSLKLTLISDTQRPRSVTRLMWSEPSWVIILQPEDDDDLKRIAEMSGAKQSVWNIVPKLGPFEFLCVRRQRAHSKKLYVSKVGAVKNEKEQR